MNFRYLIILLLICQSGCFSGRVQPVNSVEDLGRNPYFLLDGREVSQEDIKGIEEENIASITTYIDKDATTRFGKKARDGAVAIETISYATDKFEKLFSRNSGEYANLISKVSHNDIRYILNGTPLVDGYEGLLSSISRKNLKEVEVLDSLELEDLFPRSFKKHGVLIRSRRSRAEQATGKVF